MDVLMPGSGQLMSANTTLTMFALNAATYVHPRYVLDRGNLRPRRVFYYFGAVQAIDALHWHPIFKAEWRQNIDISLNASRSSPDAARLNVATGNQALLAVENGLYISMADAFQLHLSSTKSITG